MVKSYSATKEKSEATVKQYVFESRVCITLWDYGTVEIEREEGLEMRVQILW